MPTFLQMLAAAVTVGGLALPAVIGWRQRNNVENVDGASCSAYGIMSMQ